MITLLLLGLVGMGAIGATYAIGPLQKVAPARAMPAVPWAVAAVGVAAALFSPVTWLALLGVGVAIAGLNQAAFGTVWAIPERPAPAAIPANAKPQPRPPHLREVPKPPATLPRPPGTQDPIIPTEVPAYLKIKTQGERMGSIFDLVTDHAKEIATEALLGGEGAVPERFSAAWRTSLAQWPSSHPIPQVVRSQMDSNPDGPILNVDLRLPERVKWDGHLVEKWVDQSKREVGRSSKLRVYPIRPLGDDTYRFTVATAA